MVPVEKWSRLRLAGVLFALVLCVLTDAQARKKPPLHPVNLNTASSAELQQVPGIGPSTADKILQMRKSYGAFKSVDDLRAIRGIGEKRLEKMRRYLTVGKPPQGKKPNSGSQSTLAKPKATPPKSPPAKPAPTDKTAPVASENEEP